MSKNNTFSVSRDMKYNNFGASTSLKLPTYQSLPEIKEAGNVIFNTSDSSLYVSDGSQWISISGSSIPLRTFAAYVNNYIVSEESNVLYDQFDTEFTNPNGSYSAATGVFTVPKAGFYQINTSNSVTVPGFTTQYTIELLGISGSLQVYTNNPISGDRLDQYSRSVVVHLSQGINISVHVTMDAGNTCSVNGNFSAILLR